MSKETAKGVPKKRGLHGWKAFLVVFVSGTAAAFAVFGVIVGGLKLFVSSVTGGGEGEHPSAGAVPSREPVTSMTPGAINLCVLIDDAPPISITGELENRHVPEENGADGTSGEWTVTDDCSWKFIADEAQNWDLNFWYESVVSADSREARFAAADDRYQEKLEEAKKRFGTIDDEGSEEVRKGEEYFYYGELEPGQQAYTLVRKVKSSVYVVEINRSDSAPPEGSQLEEFQISGYADDVAKLVDNPLTDVVPD